jgi:hypothetical protein
MRAGREMKGCITGEREEEEEENEVFVCFWL